MKLYEKCRRHICLFLTVVMVMALALIPDMETLAVDRTLTLNDQWVSGEIDEKGSMDYYTFTISRAAFVKIEYQGWSIRDSYVEVLNGDLTESYTNGRRNVCYSSATDPKTWTGNFVFEPGTYCVRVSQYGNNLGEYRLRGSYTYTNNTEREPNDGFAQAMPLSAGAKVTGLLSQTDRVDFYSIRVPSKQKVKITYTARIPDSYFYLYDSNYMLVTDRKNVYGGISETSPKAYVYEETLKAGTYYIKIEPYSSNTGRYQLTWKLATGGSSSIPVTFVKLNKTSLKLIKGRSSTLKATTTPSGSKVSWKTSNSKVATVKNGKVTAKGYGAATITCTSGSRQATCRVTVVPDKAKFTSVRNSGSKKKLYIKSQSGVTGYEVYTKTPRGSWKLYKTVKGAKNKSLTVKKSYYNNHSFKVRAYKKIGSKYYRGAFSKVI